MGLLYHGDALWCAIPHYDALRSLKRIIPQGTSTDLQLRACKTRGRGVHPPRSLPLVILRRLSLRIASSGRRRSPHFRTVKRWAYYIWSTSVTWLPLHEHRQGNWGRSRRLSFHDSVRHAGYFISTACLIVITDLWNPAPDLHLNLPRGRERP